eukprot:6199190-Pleurochrysis_carterae.AAC.7
MQVRLDMLWKGAPTDALDAALSSTVSRHPTLHKAPFEDMLAGMRADAVAQRRICSFNPDLLEYGYQVRGDSSIDLLIAAICSQLYDRMGVSIACMRA